MAADFALTGHARNVLQEREISEEWLWSTIAAPDQVWEGSDGYIHYAKAIAERDGRVLHVVANSNVTPRRIVTVFFDRRLLRKET